MRRIHSSRSPYPSPSVSGTYFELPYCSSRRSGNPSQSASTVQPERGLATTARGEKATARTAAPDAAPIPARRKSRRVLTRPRSCIREPLGLISGSIVGTLGRTRGRSLEPVRETVTVDPGFGQESGVRPRLVPPAAPVTGPPPPASL